MSQQATHLDESTDYSRGLPEKEPFHAKKAKPRFQSRSGEHDGGRKPVHDRPTKELIEDPPPLSDAPTGEIPRDIVEQVRRKVARKAKAS